MAVVGKPARRGGDDRLEEGAVDEEVAELAPQRTERGARHGEARPPPERLVQRRVALQSRDERRRLLDEPRRRDAERALEGAARPGVHGPHLRPVEAERLEEPRPRAGRGRSPGRPPAAGTAGKRRGSSNAIRARRWSATVVLPLPALPSTSSGVSAGAATAAYWSASRRAVTSGAAARSRSPAPVPSAPARAAVPSPPPSAAAAPRAARHAPPGPRASATPSAAIRASPARSTTTTRRTATTPRATARGTAPRTPRPPGNGRRATRSAPSASRPPGRPPRGPRTCGVRAGSRAPPRPRGRGGARSTGAAGSGSSPGRTRSMTARTTPISWNTVGRSFAVDSSASSRSSRRRPDEVALGPRAAPRRERRPDAREEGLLFRDDRALARRERRRRAGGRRRLCGISSQAASLKLARGRPHGRRAGRAS